MNNTTQDSGFIALSLLLGLLLGTTAYVSSVGLVLSCSRDSRASHALYNIKRSARVVDALIAHSVMYRDLYGPSGAGPGHLPCPDTDAQTTTQPALRALSRAGPNPPCPLWPALRGVVPAHITVGVLRAGVDVEASRAFPLSYSVQSFVVNNPLGRVVNSTVLSQPITLAQVGVERYPWTLSRSPRPLPLRASALQQPVHRRVSAWLVKQLNASNMVVSDECTAPVMCELSLLYPANGSLVEGVTFERHWFWRNEWDNEYQLTVNEGCAEALSECRWQVEANVQANPALVLLQATGES